MGHALAGPTHPFTADGHSPDPVPVTSAQPAAKQNPLVTPTPPSHGGSSSVVGSDGTTYARPTTSPGQTLIR